MKVVTFVAAAVAFCFAAVPALAGLDFCNKADVRHSFAVAWKDGDDWRVEGWWNIDPGACKTVIGGDLKVRYYYFRATASGRTFDGDYTFCTEASAFTIVGEQSNCAARGYDSGAFRAIDTGKTATSFTLNLVESSPPPADPVPPPAPAPVGAPPGTYGDSYAGNAIFQECASEGDAEFCAFHSEGTKYFVYDDGRTPPQLFQLLRGMLPGTPITFDGDLEAIYDMTADVVLRRVTPRDWTAADSLLDRMQGGWYSEEDPNSQITILGAEQENVYDGDVVGRDYMWIGDWCGEYSGAGPYLSLRTEGMADDVLCYGIEKVDQLQMELIYLPRGNFLVYRRLD